MASVGHDCRHLGGGWGGERNSTQQIFLATTTTQSVFCVVVLFVLSAQSCSLLLVGWLHPPSQVFEWFVGSFVHGWFGRLAIVLWPLANELCRSVF